ncbi:MAG TPA: cellulase family glycosylhydrolase [Verrucomicrobiae bacterium]
MLEINLTPIIKKWLLLTIMAARNTCGLQLLIWYVTYILVLKARADVGTVTLDYGITKGSGTPMLFGGCKFPMQQQADDMYPKLKEDGITFLRADFYFERIIPASKCPSVEAYRENLGGIQDSSKWNYDHLFWIDSAKSNGMKTFVSATYTPTWLSYSGTYRGVPKDWAVWEDIVRKVYTRYKTRVDWVEPWNEIEYWGDLTGSPYTNREDFLVDYYYHTVHAIRSAGGTIPTGGFAFAYDEPEMLRDILRKLVAKYGLSWTDKNFDFYSVHHYGSDPGNVDTSAIRATLQAAGLNPNRPIFVDEWNYTADWEGHANELYGTKAIGYVGKAMTKFIKNDVNAAYFCLYPRQMLLTHTIYEDGGRTTLSFYTASNNIGTLLPQAYPFKILSRWLGLGKGDFVVKDVSDQTVIDACAAVNSDGKKVAFIANYYDHPNQVNITIKGLAADRVAITEYWAAAWDPADAALKTATNAVSNSQTTYYIDMPANTCVGLLMNNAAF